MLAHIYEEVICKVIIINFTTNDYYKNFNKQPVWLDAQFNWFFNWLLQQVILVIKSKTTTSGLVINFLNFQLLITAHNHPVGII